MTDEIKKNDDVDKLDQSKPESSAKNVVQELSSRSSMLIQGLSGFNPIHPIIEKFTTNHVDKFLDYSRESDKEIYKLQSSNRWFHLAYAFLILIFLVFLITFLANTNKELLSDILKILLIFVGGFGSGYGFKAYKDKKE
ncbi:MAG: hypothetical protein HQK88_00285 [Nitrospirae bacterium]|nr:hypothetical protein [Nitrospirota bacterium]MBF0535146.1 hypothetical protein [Nitrospirota bacterium]MBF0615235.1 hypothetical protein [Nitrospirota bacterium]